MSPYTRSTHLAFRSVKTWMIQEAFAYFGPYSNSTGSTILLPLCLHTCVDLWVGVCVCSVVYCWYFVIFGKIKTEAQCKSCNKVRMKQRYYFVSKSKKMFLLVIFASGSVWLVGLCSLTSHSDDWTHVDSGLVDSSTVCMIQPKERVQGLSSLNYLSQSVLSESKIPCTFHYLSTVTGSHILNWCLFVQSRC